MMNLCRIRRCELLKPFPSNDRQIHIPQKSILNFDVFPFVPNKKLSEFQLCGWLVAGWYYCAPQENSISSSLGNSFHRIWTIAFMDHQETTSHTLGTKKGFHSINKYFIPICIQLVQFNYNPGLLHCAPESITQRTMGGVHSYILKNNTDGIQ